MQMPFWQELWECSFRIVGGAILAILHSLVAAIEADTEECDCDAEKGHG